MTSATDGAAPSSAPDTGCATYLRKIANASIAIGRASGRFQVYDAIALPTGVRDGNTVFAFPGTEGWVASERDRAARSVQDAKAAAKTLGLPMPRCGFARKSVTQPAIVLGQDEAIYDAYLRYAEIVSRIGSVAESMDGKTITREFAAKQLRALAAKTYPRDVATAKRAAFEADLAKLSRNFADGTSD